MVPYWHECWGGSVLHTEWELSDFCAEYSGRESQSPRTVIERIAFLAMDTEINHTTSVMIYSEPISLFTLIGARPNQPVKISFSYLK